MKTETNANPLTTIKNLTERHKIQLGVISNLKKDINHKDVVIARLSEISKKWQNQHSILDTEKTKVDISLIIFKQMCFALVVIVLFLIGIIMCLYLKSL